MPKIRTPAQAAKTVESIGFCLLFPIKGLKLPSLWAAVKGRRPRDFDLIGEWDEDAVRLWGWKDELPRKRLAYYGKYFRGKGTFFSPEFLACFCRLEGHAGAVDDFERLYRQGRLTAEAHAVCRELEKHGPTGTLELRYALGWGEKRGNERFKKAILQAQRCLLVTHFGTAAETNAWESNVYQLTARAFPKALRAVTKLSAETARARIAARYLALFPGVTPREVARLFGWSKAEAEAVVSRPAG